MDRLGKTIPIKEVVGWMIQVCDVLNYLHMRNPQIIFRDLKPSNIMITPENQVKLIDFGIARIFKPGKSKDTAQYGTMGFAAPEQFGTGQTDPRSDIYSLGVTLFYLITGHDPAQSPFNLPRARIITPSVPDALDQVIIKATRSSPLERYQSASELQTELRRVHNSID